MDAAFVKVRVHLAIYDKRREREQRRDLLDALANMTTIVTTADRPEKIELIGQYRQDLVSVRELLQRQIDPAVRKAGAELFKSLPIPNKVPLNLTMIFRDFIKGVTYFQHQDDNTRHQPVYHRLYACGPYSHDKTFKQCTATMTKDERRRRRAIGETCYIERAIYNKIYEHEMAEMVGKTIVNIPVDAGHYHQEKEAYADYASCCPGCDVQVDVEFGLLGPVMVTLRKYKFKKLIATETYRKNIVNTGNGGIGWKYDDLVQCTKQVKTLSYFKVQAFEVETKWLRTKTAEDIASSESSRTQKTV
jgi:hypothetical protein